MAGGHGRGVGELMLCPLHLSEGPFENLDAHGWWSQTRDPKLLMTQMNASEGPERAAVQTKLCH